MRIIKLLCCVVCLLVAEMAFSQTMWKYFTPDDFAARRNKVMEKIGDGILILQAAELPEAYMPFRQDNNFYYLTGVEIPDAVLILNGKNKETTLLVPDYIPNDIKTEAMIKAGDEAAAEYKFSRVISKSGLTFLLNRYAFAGNTFYLQSSPQETAEMRRDRCGRTASGADQGGGRAGRIQVTLPGPAVITAGPSLRGRTDICAS